MKTRVALSTYIKLNRVSTVLSHNCIDKRKHLIVFVCIEVFAFISYTRHEYH